MATSNSEPGSSTGEGEDKMFNGRTNNIKVRLQKAWKKLGLDRQSCQLIFKGALAPAIVLALDQDNSYAKTYLTVSYLAGIVAILSIVVAPRAKFLYIMSANVFFAIIGFAITYLAIYCVHLARGADLSQKRYTYNGSASAVAGVWLFVQVYALNVVRARSPQLAIPAIFWTIAANIGLTYAPQYSKMEDENIFVFLLVKSMFTGFGIATAVSLLVFPFNGRTIVFKGIAAHLAALREILNANMDYLRSLETVDMFSTKDTQTGRSIEAENLEAKMQKLSGVFAKMNSDLPWAKREIAYGKLGPDDIQECVNHLKMLMIPVAGLCFLQKIFDRVADQQGFDKSVDICSSSVVESNWHEKTRVDSVRDWNELLKLLREPFRKLNETVDDGIRHVEITLQLGPKNQWFRSTRDDTEHSIGHSICPGDAAFANYFKRQTQEFLKTKETMLRGWCEVHGFEPPDDFFTNPKSELDIQDFIITHYGSKSHERLRRQLFLCLFVEFALMNVSLRTYDLICAVDRIRDKGKLSRKRLIVPGFKRVRRIIVTSIFPDDKTRSTGDLDQSEATVRLGEGFKRTKNPQHLPPETPWERFGERIRKAGAFFASPESAFGFRVAIATLSIALVNYLPQTQATYTSNRLFWAQVIISIGMSPMSSAQSVRAFLLRTLGTLVAMLLAWVAWFIVDKNPAGIIVFAFIFLHFGNYVVIKYPQYFVAGMIAQITITLVLGYELQARQIGLKIATSNAQNFYGILILGPLRLAAVCGGLFVAWLFTIFPYPNSEHAQMRKNVGAVLYLLANFHSVVQETARMRVQQIQYNFIPDPKTSPRRQLEKARGKLYGKSQFLIQNLRSSLAIEGWDPVLGGKFPTQQYRKLVDSLQASLDFMAMFSLGSLRIQEMREEGEIGKNGASGKWLSSLQALTVKSGEELMMQHITTLLTLLSASITNNNPLPPYLSVPEPWLFSQKLDELDPDFLAVRNIAEPGYASFAVMQICMKCVADELKLLTEVVKDLIGELDFSFHVERDQSKDTTVRPTAGEDLEKEQTPS